MSCPLTQLRGGMGSVELGGLRLPPGFRFRPTDEELVVHYLKSKVLSFPLPASVIPEIDLPKFNPWDLPGVFEGERYFFNLPNGLNVITTSSGYWKPKRKQKLIRASDCNQIVGIKRVLFFHLGKASNGSATDWVMHEYRLAYPKTARARIFDRNRNSIHGSMVETKDWVACRIFKKKKKKIATKVVDLAMEWGPKLGPNLPSSSSSSSCVTDLYEESSEGDHVSSSSNIASFRNGRVEA